MRETLRDGLAIVSLLMLLLSLPCHFAGELLVAPFLNDPAAIAVATEFLQIASFNFVPTGIIFCCAGLFQALGNTLPSLTASATRILLFAVPALLLADQAWFETHYLWYLSMGTVLVQAALVALLLRREMKRKLGEMAAQPELATAG